MSGQANFYPQHVNLPMENQADEARRMALNLTAALLWLQGREGGRPSRHVEALRKLSEIFGSTIELTVPEEHLPKQSSTTPTVPAQLRATPCMNKRKT